MTNKKYLTNVPLQLVISTILAIVLASIFGDIKSLDYAFKSIGTIFIDLLKMVVVPLALISIFYAILEMGDGKLTAKHLSKTLVIAIVMSIIGTCLGILLMKYVPIIGNVDVQSILGETKIKEAQAPTVFEFIISCIPVNPFNSLSNGKMLQVITLAILLGVSALYLPDEYRNPTKKALLILQKIILKITNIIMHFAPIGVFCLLYPTIAKLGSKGLIYGYLNIILCMVVGTLLYMTFVSIPALRLAKYPTPIQYFKTIILNDIIGAISGGATAYMAPRIDNLKKNTDINPASIDLLIPITSVLTRMGSTICVGIYTIFVANIFGVELSPEKIVVVLFLTFIALMCAPGIIGGTLMDCAIIWSAVGIPIEGIALLVGIDYIIDVLRTILNIQGGEIITACIDSLDKK